MNVAARVADLSRRYDASEQHGVGGFLFGVFDTGSRVAIPEISTPFVGFFLFCQVNVLSVNQPIEAVVAYV